MSTIRTRKNKNYTTINNTVLNDAALTWKAKGLAVYLLSKPDDWKVQREHLAKQSQDGISAVRSALQELEKFGYLVRQRMRNERGIIEWEYVLYEEPQNRQPLQERTETRKKKSAQPSAENQPVVPSAENPPVDNPPAEKPPVADRTLLNTNIVSTEELSTKKPSTESSSDGHIDDEEAQKTTKILSNALQQAGIGLNEIIFNQYLSLTTDYGLHAVLSGLQSSVENNKQHKFKYVAACIRNAVNGTRPVFARKEVTNGANHSRGGTQRPNQPVAPENYTAPAIQFYTDPDDPY